jgi:hypothetical protein
MPDNRTLALAAVLNLHNPKDGHWRDAAGAGWYGWHCTGCRVEWPCRTIEAMNEALGTDTFDDVAELRKILITRKEIDARWVADKIAASYDKGWSDAMAQDNVPLHEPKDAS